MKKAYYYFLFRIYWYYKIRWRESEGEAIFGVVTVSTLFLFFNFFAIETILIILDIFPNNIIIDLTFMLLFAIINYFLFIRDKHFLNCKKSRKKDFLVITYMILSFALTIFVANINRQKVYSEKPPLPEHLRKESLEGRIRDWIRDL